MLVRALSILAAIVLMTSPALAHAAAGQPSDPSVYWTHILGDPTSGDEMGLRPAMQQYAQGRSDAMFNALAGLLGGSAPRINFTQADSPLYSGSEIGMSANVSDYYPGAPAGTINMSPQAVNDLINDGAGNHSLAVNQVPHEMAHTRQTSLVLASVPQREGGAQAFADLEAAAAAKAARIPYGGGSVAPQSRFDGTYLPYVQQVMAQNGPGWVLHGQFGR